MTEHFTMPPCTLCPEDFLSYRALAAAPNGYRPQMDLRTRQILKALVSDLMGHRDVATTPEVDPDTWLSIQIPLNVLDALVDETTPPEAKVAHI